MMKTLPPESADLRIGCEVGDLVEVYSNSLKAWCEGQVISATGQTYTLRYADGLQKELPLDSTDLRLPKRPYACGQLVQVYSYFQSKWFYGLVRTVAGLQVKVEYGPIHDPEGVQLQVMPTACKDLRPAEPTFYNLSDAASLWNFLADADIRLIRGDYLVDLYEQRRPLLRRQELEKQRTHSKKSALVSANDIHPEAFRRNAVRPDAHGSRSFHSPRSPRPADAHGYQPVGMVEAFKTRVGLAQHYEFMSPECVVVSHSWEAREHPDPHGHQLGKIVEALQSPFHQKIADAEEFLRRHEAVEQDPDEATQGFKALLGKTRVDLEEATNSLRLENFLVFFDYACLHQFRRRAFHEEVCFKLAMANMHVLYAHPSASTLIVDTLAPQETLAYYRSPFSWTPTVNIYQAESDTVTEIPVTELTHNRNDYWCRGWCRAEEQWSSTKGWVRKCDGSFVTSVPLPPDVFRDRVAQSGLVFTHRSDEHEVLKLQGRVFSEVVSVTSSITLDSNCLTIPLLKDLAAAMPFYTSLIRLTIDFDHHFMDRHLDVDIVHALAVASQQCPRKEDGGLTVFFKLSTCDLNGGPPSPFAQAVGGTEFEPGSWSVQVSDPCFHASLQKMAETDRKSVV